MSLYKYSKRVVDEKEVARSQSYDLNCSYKDLTQVMRAIKGKSIAEARKILNDAVDLKKAIPFKKFSKHMAHRSELGGRKGKYPRKECREALALLRNAEANAEFKGLETEGLVVAQAAAYKQNVMRRYRRYFVGSATLGYGKYAVWSNYTTCRAELLLAKGSKKVNRREERIARKSGKKPGEKSTAKEHEKAVKPRKPIPQKEEKKMGEPKQEKAEGKKEEKKVEVEKEGKKAEEEKKSANPLAEKLTAHKEKVEKAKT